MTSTTSGTEVVLKADELGRVRTPITRRQSLLEEFEKSGLSGTKFAALAGVKYSTFASWLQKQRRKSAPSRAKERAGQVRWLETVIEQAQSPADKGKRHLGRLWLDSDRYHSSESYDIYEWF